MAQQEKSSTVIGISGTHGTGKTTLLYKLAHDYKIRYGGTPIHLVTEVARSCPFSFFGEGTSSSEEAQMWIFSAQVKAELEARKGGIVLMDRTVFDTIAYTMEVNEDLAAEMLGMAQRLQYDTIHFVRPWGKLIGDGERSTDEGLRDKVDENLSRILLSSDLPVRQVKIKRMN